MLNPDLASSAGYKLSSLVILNAGDLHNTHFACIIDNEGVSKSVNYIHDPKMMTLSIDAEKTPIFDISSVRFGGPDDLDLC